MCIFRRWRINILIPSKINNFSDKKMEQPLFFIDTNPAEEEKELGKSGCTL